jgi:hypothetical protein
MACEIACENFFFTHKKMDQDKSNPKYVGRSDAGRTKRGTREDDTNASHLFSFEMMNAIEVNSPGAPLSSANKEALLRAMNNDHNLRIKKRSGNTMTAKGQIDNDHTNDVTIWNCVKCNSPISPQRAVRRAIQAHRGACTIARDFPKYAGIIGEWDCDVHGKRVKVKDAANALKFHGAAEEEEEEEEMVEYKSPGGTLSPVFVNQTVHNSTPVYNYTPGVRPPSPAARTPSPSPPSYQSTGRTKHMSDWGKNETTGKIVLALIIIGGLCIGVWPIAVTLWIIAFCIGISNRA